MEKFLEGEYTPPVPLPSKEGPESTQAAPGQPNLSVLAYANKVKVGGLSTLRTPDKLLLSWHDHPTWGEDFRSFLDSKRKEFPLDVKDEKKDSEKTEKNQKDKPDTESNGKPQRGPATPQAGNPPKLACILASEVPTPKLCEAVCASIPEVSIVITIGQKVYLVNTSEGAHAIKCGAILAGYFKGKFWSLKDGSDEEVGTADVPFELRTPEDMVMLNSKYTSMQQVIEAKRQVNPSDATVCYHTLTDCPSTSALLLLLCSVNLFKLYFY